MKHPATVILRHARENLKKCSLTGLEKKEGFYFFTYPKETLPDISSYILLKVGAPPLSKEDQGRGLLLIDGTWRLANVMEAQIPAAVKQSLLERSLPEHFRTAYPRRQTECPDPERGLSSLEALYIALFILGRPLEGLLDHYYWKELFFQKNPELRSKDPC
jgi:pre-rRNA-processing protein TSR3